MKNKVLQQVALGCALLGSTGNAIGQVKLSADNIDQVLKEMTLHEKALLVVGTGMAGVNDKANSNFGSFAKLVPGAAGTTVGIARLGIPSVVLADGPAGLRIDSTRPYDSHTYYCTHFPIGLSLASSWNTELVKEVGSAIGNEVKEYGADVLLAPGVNIQRDPLGGRSYEYYSEDPVLTGYIAAAYINGVQSQGVGTSIKHYAFNSQETARIGNDAQVSQRAARELYLKNFEIAIKKSQPWTVMSAYNLVNGTMTSERYDLLTTILRDEWGFKGMVMTDWLGGMDPIRRNKGTDRVANMIAGNDLIEPGEDKDVADIENAVKNGTLDVKYLDANVRRILELIVKTPRFKGYKYSNQPDLKEHAMVTRNAAAEGTILLENKGTLPLASSVKKLALYGVNGYDAIPGGSGSGKVNLAYTVSLVEGLRNQGYEVDEPLLNAYTEYIQTQKKEIAKVERRWWEMVPRPEEKILDVDNSKAARENDIAIITIGRLAGEGGDRKASEFDLTQAERDLITQVTNAFHQASKKAVVVLNISSALETASWKHIPDAILVPWQCGQEIGNSVAEILSGKLSPSGKLSMTWPIRYTDAASSKNFPSEGLQVGVFEEGLEKYKNVRNVGYTLYEEGIYVGYRYFDTFKKDVSYPFGYGLSYTTFAYSKPTVADKGDRVEVSVTITNTGKTAGKEVVQVYVTAPKGAIEKPAQELKAFGKTRSLRPGENQTLTLAIEKTELASFNTQESAWVADGGTYTFHVGASSRDIKGNASLKLKKQVQKVHNVLKPTMNFTELKK